MANYSSSRAFLIKLKVPNKFTMKVTIKTLQHKAITLEVEPMDTVSTVKQMLFESDGLPVVLQKIIYAGKILSDDQTIESIGVKENEFMVVLISKVKQEKPKEEVKVTVKEEKDEYETAVRNMMEMGFDRPRIEEAMKAAQNNADRAVEFLMAPPDLQNPQLDQLRQAMQSNPEALQGVLQQLAQTHPQLLEAIASQEFIPDQELTQEDRNAVERLVQLGFDRAEATEAYLACDKNENSAANYLFDQD